jgi:uncharacterized protein (DUF58 family)
VTAAARAPWKARGSIGAFPWVTGRFVAAAIGVALVFAASAFMPLLAWIALVLAIALASSAIADIAVGPRRADVIVEREPHDHLALRSPVRLGYVVTNRGATSIRFGIVDSPVPLLQLPEEESQGLAGARRRTVVHIDALPTDRGEASLGRLYVWYENAIGLIRRRVVIDAPAPVRIFPDLSAVERYGMLARRGRLMEAGFRRLRLRGGGGEFAGIREYQPDDEFRAIDWKATARRGKLMVSEHDVERSQTVMLVLDSGRLMTPRIGAQRKFDFAVTAALSVAQIASLADDKVGLLAFSRDIVEHVAPRSGAHHVSGLVQRIFDLQPRFEESDYERAFAYLRRRQPKRSLVIVFTDMFDPVASATVLANMSVLSPRHLVVCVLMNDEAVASALERPPVDALGAYRAAVASQLLVERAKAAAILARRGVSVIDVAAADLTVSLINAYIDVKSRALL